MTDTATTIRVRGEGGDVFDMDVPTSGVRREVFDYQRSRGQLVVLGAVGEKDGKLRPVELDDPTISDQEDGIEPDVDNDAELDALRAQVAELEAQLEAAGTASGDAKPDPPKTGPAEANDPPKAGLPPKAELLEMAADRGVEVNASWSAQKIADALGL